MTTFTCAIPWESRRTTPIWDGVTPLRASLQIWSTTWSGVVFNYRNPSALCSPSFLNPAVSYPAWWLTAVWDSRGRDTLSVGVKTTHFCRFRCWRGGRAAAGVDVERLALTMVAVLRFREYPSRLCAGFRAMSPNTALPSQTLSSVLDNHASRPPRNAHSAGQLP